MKKAGLQIVRHTTASKTNMCSRLGGGHRLPAFCPLAFCKPDQLRIHANSLTKQFHTNRQAVADFSKKQHYDVELQCLRLPPEGAFLPFSLCIRFGRQSLVRRLARQDSPLIQSNDSLEGAPSHDANPLEQSENFDDPPLIDKALTELLLQLTDWRRREMCNHL